MLFLTYFSYPPQNREAVQTRFKKTGGKPPAGVKMIGRWHAMGGGKGVFVSETDDPMAMAKWSQEWSDLLSTEICPVLDDADAMKRIG